MSTKSRTEPGKSRDVVTTTIQDPEAGGSGMIVDVNFEHWKFILERNTEAAFQCSQGDPVIGSLTQSRVIVSHRARGALGVAPEKESLEMVKAVRGLPGAHLVGVVLQSNSAKGIDFVEIEMWVAVKR